MNKSYTNERNVQIVIALLKAHGIRKVIVSPGTTNVALVGSIQYDPWFEIFSAVDERSAAYMACGLAAEAGEPVVLSCTGATASRNYMPGLTEAYYRKLPVLAITSIHDFSNVGHLMPQVIDRTVSPRDVVGLKIELPSVRDDKEAWDCEIKVNTALLELKRKGGGPVHINLATGASCSFCVKNLPAVRMIERIGYGDIHPEMPAGRIAVFAGSHARWSPELTEAVDRFCASRDAVVFCDHTSGYHGKYKALYALVAGQEQYDPGLGQVDLLIHIGEVSGDYFTAGRMKGCQVWRVSEDGEIRDTFPSVALRVRNVGTVVFQTLHRRRRYVRPLSAAMPDRVRQFVRNDSRSAFFQCMDRLADGPSAYRNMLSCISESSIRYVRGTCSGCRNRSSRTPMSAVSG